MRVLRVLVYLKKLPFLKKKVKKGAKYSLFLKSKQNNFTFQKSCRIYTFYKKKILGNGAKWNLRKDYKYNILKK